PPKSAMTPHGPPGGFRPGAAPLPPRSSLPDLVRQQFSGYGTRSGMAQVERAGPDERALLADDYLGPALRIIVGVFLASLFAFVGTSPTFDAPGIWSNTFRFDTALVVVWGPLLAWTMARLKLARAVRIYLVLSIFIEPFSETMLRQHGYGYWDTVLWPSAVA